MTDGLPPVHPKGRPSDLGDVARSPDDGDGEGVPLPPGFTQFHPMSPKVTQPGVPGKGRFWLARVEAARPALPKYQVLMTKYRSYVKELFTSRPEALSP